MAHTGGGHPSGSLQLLTGDPAVQDKPRPDFPDCFTVANYLRADANRKLPNYVGVNGIHGYDGFQIAGPAYLGPGYEPFRVSGDPNDPRFEVPNIGLAAQQAARLGERIGLRKSLDRLSAAFDRQSAMHALDAFETQAANLLTSPDARAGFRPEPGRSAAARSLWPQRLGPAMPDGPPAGRGRRRAGDHGVRRSAVRPRFELGRPRGEPPCLRGDPVPRGAVRSGGDRTGRRYLPARARSAGVGDRHRRVRPHAAHFHRGRQWQRPRAARPRPLAAMPTPCCSPAAAFAPAR